MGGFARTRIGTQLASCIDLDEVVESMLNEICNNLEFGKCLMMVLDPRKILSGRNDESHQKGG